jgi:aldose 1-epimerase
MHKCPWIISALAFEAASCQKIACMNLIAKQEVFGRMPDGREVKIFTLTNSHGLKARVTEYGAILVSMESPDQAGHLADLTLGYDTLEGWLGNTAYLGATVGRFANRIKDGKFSLDGKAYTLATNNDPGGIPCALHGGLLGFDKVLWSGQATADNGVEFTYVSQDGEEGYPGQLSAKVTYTLTEANELIWEARASTDAPTLINIAHHSYWNLSGHPALTINDHILQIEADHYLPTDAGLIPTGVIAPVQGTPMDFTRPLSIGERLEADFQDLKFGGGYDHCWVLRQGEGLRLAARLMDPKTGRVMEVFTNQPAIQFYGGNFLDGSAIGKKSVPYARRTGLCLETEAFPDAPNQPHFPSPVLRPGDSYHHLLVHKFTA